jgi:hypothetical protein
MYCVIREKGDVYNALRSISGRRKSVWDEIKQNRTAIVRFFCVVRPAWAVAIG